jgi:hypothetical protein
MFKSRIHYWGCSRFADWIRGEKKPFALTLEEWDDWREEQAKKRPIRFYISDTLLDKIQNFVYFPRDVFWNVRCYIRNRFIDKMQYLKTGLEPGKYYDLDDRIIHGLFNELKDFVETELAWMNQLSKDKKYRSRKLRSRSPEDGIEYLKWGMELKDDNGMPTRQATSFAEILELYNWWKNYPNRPDPMDVSGWSDIYDDKTVDEAVKNEVSHNLFDLEEQQDKEEEDMLIRLIKVRKSLWT